MNRCECVPLQTHFEVGILGGGGLGFRIPILLNDGPKRSKYPRTVNLCTPTLYWLKSKVLKCWVHDLSSNQFQRFQLRAWDPPGARKELTS